VTDLIAGERNPYAPPFLPTPDGCHWCGSPRRAHGRQYIPPVGMHGWTAPTPQQRLARMHARRDQRKNR
jgi:hypothetical protein